MQTTTFILMIMGCTLKLIKGDLYLTINKLKPLLETQEIVLDHLDKYVKLEERRLSLLKRTIYEYKIEHETAKNDTEDYLGNPINAFTLVKHLTSDLQYIKQTAESSSELLNDVTQLEDVLYPSHSDLVGTAEAIARLQDIYNLNVTDLAQGILNGVKYSSALSSSDCFDLGRILFYERDYQNSLSWMLEALGKYNYENYLHSPLSDTRLLDDLSMVHGLIENTDNKLNLTNDISNLLPKPLKFLENITIPFHHEWNTEIDPQSDSDDDHTFLNKQDKEIYKSLCRGELRVKSDISKRLKCHYAMDNHPFLKIAPFKIEQLHMNPDIFLFYDVVSDDEIDIVKNLSIPKLKHAAVVGQNIVKFRISVSAWLKDNASPVIARITRRISDMTGLNATYSQKLQVGNYGAGGHYEPHYDFDDNKYSRNDNFTDPDERIATLMFYMSEVDQGGATVFMELGLSVFPVKKAAVFWMNMLPSGRGNFATRHAACPVLKGSKWVANKWITNAGQEFLKPCNLEP